jgi:SAM-dependent methyltransferase
MLREAGEVFGKVVLDMGCGEGRFCRMLRERGAAAVGLDPTPFLIETAHRRDPSGHYLRASGECLPLRDASFDLVVSYLTLVDIPDYRSAIREMARVTKPGGKLLIANLNNFASTSTGWYRNEEGEKLHYPVDHYMEERPLWLEWKDIRIVNWHRPLSAYMECFLGAGLRLERYLEPVPPPEAIAQRPDLAEDVRVPVFNVMVWSKEGP